MILKKKEWKRNGKKRKEINLKDGNEFDSLKLKY